LANEKTPLRETASSAPQRSQKSADRSTVARRRIIIGVVIAVVVLGGLYFLLGRGDKSPLEALGIGSSPPVPEFSFTNVVPAFEATVAQTNKDKMKATAKDVAPKVQDVVTQLFQAGYVDPDTWGDAGAIEDLFTSDAQKQLDANIDTLTLGTDADATVATVQPGSSKLKVTVLMDGDANAIRAMAQPTFVALATNDDGTYTKIKVIGTVFLVHEDNEWKIEAFDLNRTEEPGEAPATSASTSPSETP
jgi:hypothetical protein